VPVNADDVIGTDEVADVGVCASQAGEEIAVVRVDLRRLARSQCVGDGEAMKRERLAEDERFRNGRRGEIDPDVRAGGRTEPAPIDAGDLLCPAISVDEDGVQLSPF
jgi:hypothetical protein